MTDMVYVEPAPEGRIELARWAVAQTPKVGTAGPNTFEIPAQLFSSVPEPALIGATVDGHRYVSPDEEEAKTPAGEGTAEAELTGVATAEGFAVARAGEALPDVPDEAYPPDAEPIPAAEDDDAGPETEDGGFPCAFCGRTFSTKQGRATHVRRSHPEQEI
ncbi:C2H2-type zinc finger protein [Streptomyces sp. BH104]|uniref:C2H2-type zinc finger protein n=1 Tax=Streptomyces sp. BH104 TaxID=3410407 RepID=UPI003BB7B987